MTEAAAIAANLRAVNERIGAAARRARRDPASITLVGVSKTKPLADLLAAWDAGLRHFGENRVQEAETKFSSLPDGAVRHLIGPIQSNKAARAARIAGVVQTVDSPEIARRLDLAAAGAGKILGVYLEVNTGAETTKAGVPPEALGALVAAVRAHGSLDLLGLMAIPPPGATRPHFARLRELASAHQLTGLSMGMSDDFEAAIEEGATVVRIGSAIFGPRSGMLP